MFRIFGYEKHTMAVSALALAVCFVPAGAIANPKLTILHALSTRSGGNPLGSLFVDSQGNLYGTTRDWGGGKYCQNSLPQCGVVFKVTPAKTYSVLYKFCSLPSCTDGLDPQAGLVADSQGNLYGTTVSGGQGYDGTVFKVAPDGTETVLHSFCTALNCADGDIPVGGVTMDSQGNLYGATTYGGYYGNGAVYKLAPDGSNFSVLYSFCAQSGCTDGEWPGSGVIMDGQGNIYGTTTGGGNGNGNQGCKNYPSGCGTVYKLDGGDNETVLYNFCSQSNCTDGELPQAGLFLNTDGNLYGTTTYGGGGSCTYGCGLVYKVSPDGSNYSVVHSFAGNDGYWLYSNLIGDSQGNLYGVSAVGGSTGLGLAFELAPNGTETPLHTFCSETGCKDGSTPDYYGGGLIMDSSRNLYGTTYQGGKHREGIVYKIVP